MSSGRSTSYFINENKLFSFFKSVNHKVTEKLRRHKEILVNLRALVSLWFKNSRNYFSYEKEAFVNSLFTVLYIPNGFSFFNSSGRNSLLQF
jgi:hypothetical protein